MTKTSPIVILCISLLVLTSCMQATKLSEKEYFEKLVGETQHYEEFHIKYGIYYIDKDAKEINIKEEIQAQNITNSQENTLAQNIAILQIQDVVYDAKYLGKKRMAETVCEEFELHIAKGSSLHILQSIQNYQEPTIQELQANVCLDIVSGLTVYLELNTLTKENILTIEAYEFDRWTHWIRPKRPSQPQPIEYRDEFNTRNLKDPLQAAVTSECVIGDQIANPEYANKLCTEEFGEDWKWAEWHDYKDEGSSMKVNLTTNRPNNRVWVNIYNQQATCYKNTLGMTWAHKEKNNEEYFMCTSDAFYTQDHSPRTQNHNKVCNPYTGDVPCTECLQLLCVKI